MTQLSMYYKNGEKTYWSWPKNFSLLNSFYPEQLKLKNVPDRELDKCPELEQLRKIMEKYKWPIDKHLPIKFNYKGPIKLVYVNIASCLADYVSYLEYESIYGNIIIVSCCEKIMEFDEKEFKEIKEIHDNPFILTNSTFHTKRKDWLEYISQEHIKRMCKKYPEVLPIEETTKCPNQSKEIRAMEALENNWDNRHIKLELKKYFEEKIVEVIIEFI